MPSSVLIRGARQLLTLRGAAEPRRGPALRELGIIPDGALLIQDGRIVEAGPSRRVENLVEARHAREIDVTGHVVMPGFVDCHTHLVCGPVLGSQPQEALAAALHAVQHDSTSRLESRAHQIVNGMARHGTTTLEAKSGYGADAAAELKTLRVLRRIEQHPLDVVSTLLSPRAIPNGGDPAAYLDWFCTEVMPRIKHRGLARFADFYAAAPAFTAEHGGRYLEAARALGFHLKMHAAEFEPDGCVPLAVALGAVSADHLDYATADDVELLARSQTMAVLLPGPAFYLGRDHQTPARALIDAGAAVALGTNFDSAASPGYSMQMIVSLACAQLHMTPAEALCAATFNAACAIGCGRQTGSLETGKLADVIVLHAADYREIPCRFGVNQVRMTIKRGVTVYQEAKVGALALAEPLL